MSEKKTKTVSDIKAGNATDRKKKTSEPKKALKKKPIVILGTASSRNQAPFEDDAFEIWGVSTCGACEDVKRVDRLFEMHPRRYWGQPAVIDRLTEFKGPVYMQDHFDEIPNSVKYPRDEIKAQFYLDAMGGNLYVTNTIAWMILCALYEGYTDINLFGVHMAHDTEYAYQRSSCSWVLGIIQGWIMQGLPYHITITEESSLLKAEYEYGFDEPTKTMQYIKGRIDGMKKGISQARNEITAMEKQILRTEGAVAEAKNLYEKVAGYK